MTDREQLIKLINQKVDSVFFKAEELADYLLENGVIVPPCKVGQTVYIIYEPDFEEDYVLDVEVSEMGQDFRGMWISVDLPLGMRLSKYVFPNNLGKTVFLTKEEAEQKLKELG